MFSFEKIQGGKQSLFAEKFQTVPFCPFLAKSEFEVPILKGPSARIEQKKSNAHLTKFRANPGPDYEGG
jgi:hypothetical protein